MKGRKKQRTKGRKGREEERKEKRHKKGNLQKKTTGIVNDKQQKREHQAQKREHQALYAI